MRPIGLKILPAMLLLLFAHSGFSQTYLTIETCDTIVSNPSPLFSADGNYVVTFHSANNTRLGYSVSDFSHDSFGDLYIYDGSTTSTPRITMLGDMTLPNQAFFGETTGPYLTIFFRAAHDVDFRKFKMRIRCVETPVVTSVLQPLKEMNASGSIDAADYDKDGDKDLLIGPHIFRNDSYFDTIYKFERKSNLIGNWSDNSLCAADFDGDGFKDIFIIGTSTAFGSAIQPSAAIYRNNGNETFTLVTPQFFTGVNKGSCSIVDFNKDGRPDIAYTGSADLTSTNNLIFKVYLNTGNMNFTDANITLPGATGLFNSSMSWADNDGDGDPDLVINGQNNSTNITDVYINSGTSLTKLNMGISATTDGPISWVDVNKDGRPDIVNTGYNSPQRSQRITPQIYFNNGNNNFTQTVTNLPSFAFLNLDWADYDGDNDLDVVMIGSLFPAEIRNDAGVFKNNGNGQFTRVSSIDNVNEPSRIQWADFNHDGKPDIVGGGYFIKNLGADSFRVASFSATLYKRVAAATVIDDFNNDGLVDIFMAGNDFKDVDCNIESRSTFVLGRSWRLSGVPKFTEVANVANLNPITEIGFLGYYDYQWGDFDSDGKLDILMTMDNNPGTATNFLVVYKNNGNNNFSLFFNTQTTPLPNPPQIILSIRYATLIDMDNDGINELLTGPNTIYKNNNGQWTISSYSTANSIGNIVYAEIADYDQDGYMDAVETGISVLSVFHNDHNGNLVNIAPVLSPGSTFGNLSSSAKRQVIWEDIDNDGDPDVVSSNLILENKNGKFNLVLNSSGYFARGALGDFNNDGYKDIVTVPWLTGGIGPLQMNYSEQGTGFVANRSMGTTAGTMQQEYNQGIVSFDIDNDGDDDIVYSGLLGGCISGSSVIVNEPGFTNKFIHVVSPNGSEHYPINNSIPIQWFGNQLAGTVKIELSRDGGSSWQNLSVSSPSASSGGEFLWKVTGPVSDQCLIRISQSTGSASGDKSDARFSISDEKLVANAGRDTAICAGTTAHLGIVGSASFSYSWHSSDGSFTSTESNPTVYPSATTNYYLSVSNGPETSRDTVNVSVITVNANLTDTVLDACIGQSYTIGVPAQSDYSYLWSSASGGFSSTIANPMITASTDMHYYLTVTDEISGCYVTTGVLLFADSCIDNTVRVFPNPATGQVTIQVATNEPFPLSFTLMNSTGIPVKMLTLTDPTTSFNVSAFASGIYYYQVLTSGGKKLKSGRLVIAH